MKRFLLSLVAILATCAGAFAQGTELWDVAKVTIDHTYFADAGWTEETQSTADYTAGKLNVHIAVNKAAQWQAQVFLLHGITFNPAKQYDFAFKMTANKNLTGVTFKVDDDSGIVNANMAYAVNAGETQEVSVKNITGAPGNGKMVFDFGFATAGTDIVISDISVVEHDPVAVNLDPSKPCDATSGNPALAIDDNIGTRWESAFNDNQMWQVNYGSPKQFNTIQIIWEGAYASSFKLLGSNNGTDWTTLKEITDQTLSGFPNTQTIDLGETVTYQYVRFVGVKRALPYGYSFWEFRTFVKGASVLTTYEVTPSANYGKVGSAITLNVKAQDQNSLAMTVESTYEVSPAGAATVEGNTLTIAQAGLITVTAKSADKESTFNVLGYAGENLALSTNIATDNKIIAQSDFTPNGTDAFHAVDPDAGSVYQGSKTNGTTDAEADRTFDSWFVIDLGAKADIELVTITFEGACSQDYHLDFATEYNDDATAWTTAYNHTGAAGINGRTDAIFPGGEKNLTNNTGVRYVRFFSTKAATQWGMKIFDMKVFGEKITPDGIDVNVAPEVKYATLYSDKELTTTDNVKIYTAKVGDGKLILTELGSKTVPANTAVLVDASSHFAESTTGATFAGDNDLKGVAVDTPTADLGAEGILVLDAVDGKPGFYNFTGATLKANRAYLEKSASTPAKGLVIVFEGNETTGISSIEAVEAGKGVYNLNGIRMDGTNLKKGVYVVNGKKVIVK